jgi:hypothetical protein
MKIIKPIFFFLAAALVMSACTKKPDVGATSTVNMSGAWWIKYYTSNTALTGYVKLNTYNTADPNSGQVWVDDGGIWPFKSKFDVDYPNLTFKPMASTPNTEITGKTVKVIEGKILKDAAHSLTGHPVDSIYLKLEFSDDPGTVYEVKGHYDTGFFEDHP